MLRRLALIAVVAIGLVGAEREKFLSEVALPRLVTLREAIAGRATPWYSVTPS